MVNAQAGIITLVVMFTGAYIAWRFKRGSSSTPDSRSKDNEKAAAANENDHLLSRLNIDYQTPISHQDPVVPHSEDCPSNINQPSERKKHLQVSQLRSYTSSKASQVVSTYVDRNTPFIQVEPFYGQFEQDQTRKEWPYVKGLLKAKQGDVMEVSAISLSGHFYRGKLRQKSGIGVAKYITEANPDDLDVSFAKKGFLKKTSVRILTVKKDGKEDQKEKGVTKKLHARTGGDL